jgi:hypothetical protein
MLARQRREHRLHESRVADRERQRACRERRRGKPEARPDRVPSRATPPADVTGILEQIEAALDHAARLSRATLARQLRAILEQRRPIGDQAGPCHTPASARREV